MCSVRTERADTGNKVKTFWRKKVKDGGEGKLRTGRFSKKKNSSIGKQERSRFSEINTPVNPK